MQQTHAADMKLAVHLNEDKEKIKICIKHNFQSLFNA